MLRLVYLHRRRLFFVWLAFMLPKARCGCFVPSHIASNEIGFYLAFAAAFALVIILGVMLLLWLVPTFAGALDLFLPLVFVINAVTIALSFTDIPKPVWLGVIIFAIFLTGLIGFGHRSTGRWSWFAYRGSGSVVLPGTSEEIWSWLTLRAGPAHAHYAANLLGLQPDPDDSSRFKGQYAAAKGTVLTMSFTNLRETYPSAMSYDYAGDQKILDGVFVTGRLDVTLEPVGPDRTRVTLKVTTVRMPFLAGFSCWLGDLAQDNVEHMREGILKLRPISVGGACARKVMKGWKRLNAA